MCSRVYCLDDFISCRHLIPTLRPLLSLSIHLLSQAYCGCGLSRMGIDAHFRYYFQHPWSRLIVAYLVTFFNFLIFAEDPVSHSQTEAHMIVVGNCFSFLFNKYPGLGWNILKVLLWILAIIAGMLAGKFIFHRQLFGKSCAPQGSGMCRVMTLMMREAFSVFFHFKKKSYIIYFLILAAIDFFVKSLLA